MITFQTHVQYGGDAAKAPFKSLTLAFHLPVYEYTAVGGVSTSGSAGLDAAAAKRATFMESNANASVGRQQDVTRLMTAATESNSVEQLLTATTYRIELADSAIAGGDDAERMRATQYYARALLEGNIDKLMSTVTVQYLMSDGFELGNRSFDFICLLKLPADDSADATTLTSSKLGYLAVNKTTYSAFRQSLLSTSLKGDDSLALQALSYVAESGMDTPTLREDVAADFGRWLDRKTRGADATAILDTIRKYFDPLFDFSLAIPEIKSVKIAGNITLTPAAGDTIVPKDFQDLEVSAECNFDNAPSRSLTFNFADVSKIAGATAPFSLTAAANLYANGLASPVTVRVRGFGTDLWSKDYASDDSKLGSLDIRIPKPARLILTPPPATANESAAKKLRGRVLTLSKDCPLKDVLVLVQAKTKAEAAWKTVGAATTDASGNFAIPYPYGNYVQARAMVSLSPKETADIPCTDKENESISDDFLYLLLTNPDCAQPASQEECDCDGTDKPNRLPDHSDLIGSDAYTQDIGGTCVNLSKPNRTISEFNYQAIVRASDPDVANYTLTRVETGLDAVDISLMVGLTNEASELSDLANIALAIAMASISQNPTAFAGIFLSVMESALPHVKSVATAFADQGPAVTATVLASSLHHVDAVIAILTSFQTRTVVEDFPTFPPEAGAALGSANRLRPMIALAIDSLGSAARYELRGGASLRRRQPVSLNNPVAWQDDPETAADSSGAMVVKMKLSSEIAGRLQQKFGAPLPPSEPPPNATFSQAVTVATGHLLHYKAEFKSDGYSLGDLLYSLPLAPGQKKEIVVFDSSHTLVGAESQTQAQNERLAMGLINDRDIATQIGGRVSESLRGSSSANTSGISAGFGTGGQGYGGTGAYGGSGSAVIGVAGGTANANSNASQDSSRDVAEFFGEKLRQSIMQNAEGYRQLNASVVTTVQEGQRYGVTSEVVANHNHCHALTMMYFEVLRHYAIFHELSAVEECVFVPLLLTKFSTENVARWRDVLAPALLPMPSETYLKPADSPNAMRPHPLLKAFDADQRIRTNYANVDMPAGSYDDERINFIRGSMRLRVSIPRPRTRFDRIMSLPVTTKTLTSREIDPEATQAAMLSFPKKMAEYATKTAACAGFNVLFGDLPPDPPGIQYKTIEKEILVKEAIFDAFMKLDANYESVPPAQCIRVVNFFPPPKIPISVFGNLNLVPTTSEDFFAENTEDRQQWQAYATLLGYKDVLTMLNAHFRGNLISEWDTIFNTDIVPLAFEKILSVMYLENFAVDFAPEAKYHGGERFLRVNIAGTTSKKRNELPNVIKLELATNSVVKSLKEFITLIVQDVNITYSTSHYNGTLFSGSLNDDLLDGTQLFIPENSDEKRNPRREDRYLAAKLIEHLNSNLEYYNKVLWYNLDPDRRYMLLDGFTIQIYEDDGTPITTSDGLRSLASVVKNEVIAIAGNSLVLPVAPGYRVNGSFVQKKADGEVEVVTLFDHYKPLTPSEPFRISVPSKGVFAEAVQGVCNACEKIETERLQDWSRFPNTDEPTPILPIATPTPTVTDWKAAFKDFATPIVNIQNAPALPAPGEGLQNLADLLSKSGVFKDITGLDANQQNVIRTYLSNQENAKAFAEMAKEMAMQQHNTQNTGKIMDSIKSAKDTGAINQDDYSKLVKDHLQQQIDGGKTRPPAITAGNSQLAGVTAESVRAGVPVDATQSFPDGTVATFNSTPKNSTTPGNIDFTVPGAITPLKQPSGDACWAAVVAMLQAWKSGTKDATVAGEIAKLPPPYPQLLSTNQKLVTADKNALFEKMGLVIDPIGLSSAMPDAYLKLMQQYGPLWATVDADLTEKTSEHAKLIYGMRGDGTANGTMMRIIDPKNGTPIEQSFQAFMTEFEQLARTTTEVALFGQIARFSAPISGEGASTDDVFDVLSGLARDASMGLTANPAAKLIPVPNGTDPYSFDHNWSGGWTGKTVVSTNGIESTALEFPIEHEMAGETMTMPFRVLDTLSWDNARVIFGTDQFVLPLTRRFLIAADGANAPLYMKPNGSRTFPLEAIVQSHVTLLFGYVVDVGTGAVVPLDLTSAPAAGLDVWLSNGGSSQAATTNKRAVLALYDLCMNEPRVDFQPKQGAPMGPGAVARFYPLLSVWCANACDQVAADFSMARPAKSAMTENMMPGAPIGGSFYTDSNEEFETVWDELDPNVQAQLGTPTGIPLLDLPRLGGVVAAMTFIPSPRWNSIFAHYRLDADLPSTAVVDRSKGERTNPDARKEMKSAITAYAATPVMKVAGQGAFDNIHMAPEMAYKGAAASMAPICQHDCLHLHWRWSVKFSDNYVWGWSGGAPYAKAGAPMIPENQDLKVSLAGTTFKYQPVASQVGAMQWQIFLHHGMAYATKLTDMGEMLPMIDATSITDILNKPPFEKLYYHNRFWESAGADRTADKPRLDEGAKQANFKPLEDM